MAQPAAHRNRPSQTDVPARLAGELEALRRCVEWLERLDRGFMGRPGPSSSQAKEVSTTGWRIGTWFPQLGAVSRRSVKRDTIVPILSLLRKFLTRR